MSVSLAEPPAAASLASWPASAAAGPWLAALAACATAAWASWALARHAPRLGLCDAGLGSWRKLQDRPVPLVGGAAIGLGLVAGGLFTLAAGAAGDAVARGLVHPESVWWAARPAAWAVVASLAGAFAVGLADDALPGGLSAGRKLGWQAVAGMPLAASASASLAAAGGGWGPTAALFVLLVGAACVVQNAINTFDNSDGAATGLAATSLWVSAPWAAAALFAFLPFNMVRGSRAGREAGSRPGTAPAGQAPACYLGDSGSHLLGMLILVHPLAWPGLLLPLLDLGRVAWERHRDGQAIWKGDRRHLAHRLQRTGLGSWAVLGVLLAIALPGLLGGGLAATRGHWEPAVAGAAWTAGLFGLAVRASR